MARAGRSAALVVLALLGSSSSGASAGKQHFIQRVVQSQQEQEERPWQRGPPPDTDRLVAAASSARGARRRFAGGRLPPTLGEALSKALSYEANRSRLDGARWRPRPSNDSGDTSSNGNGSSSSSGSGSGSDNSSDSSSSDSSSSNSSSSDGSSSDGSRDGSSVSSGRTEPWTALEDRWPAGSTAAGPLVGLPARPPTRSVLGRPPFSEHGHQHGFRLIITESPHGCSCSGTTAAPDRTLSFLISGLPAAESGLLDLHLPIASGAGRVPTTLTTRLALCRPGGAGRSVTALLRLKTAPRRPRWRHAIVGDRLAQLLRRPSAAAAGRAERHCLQLVLPAVASVILDRSGHRLAHLTCPLHKHRAG